MEPLGRSSVGLLSNVTAPPEGLEGTRREAEGTRETWEVLEALHRNVCCRTKERLGEKLKECTVQDKGEIGRKAQRVQVEYRTSADLMHCALVDFVVNRDGLRGM